MNHTIVTFAALIITLLGSLIVTTWKMATMMTRMHDAILELRVAVAELKEVSRFGMEQLKVIPLLEQRISQLERLVHQDIQEKIMKLWERVIAGGTRASRPDIDLVSEPDDSKRTI